jgi:hypothetical protein
MVYYEKTSYVWNLAIEQRSAEDVLAAGMLVADVLLLANGCM